MILIADYGAHTVKTGKLSAAGSIVLGGGRITKATKTAAANALSAPELLEIPSCGLHPPHDPWLGRSPAQSTIEPRTTAVDTDAMCRVLQRGAAASAPSSQQAPPIHCGVLLLPTWFPLGDMERLVHMAFEELRWQRLHIAFSSPHALYATGATSGIVIDVGHEEVRALPVVECRPRLGAALFTSVAAGHAQSYVAAQLCTAAETADSARSSRAPDNVVVSGDDEAPPPRALLPFDDAIHDWKASLSTASRRSGPSTAVLPDGSTITLPPAESGREWMSQTLLQPASLVQRLDGAARLCPLFDLRTALSVPDLILRTTREAALSIPAACRWVVVCGGASLTPGVDEAIRSMFPCPVQRAAATTVAGEHPISVGGNQQAAGRCGLSPFPGTSTTPALRPVRDRQYAQWVGASILTRLSSFTATACVSAAQYGEHGPHRVALRFLADQ